jgi:hypothetical protein
MSDEDYCEGCVIKPRCNYKEDNNGDCPCTNCLVKVMCKDDGCNKWIKWDEKANELINVRGCYGVKLL